MKITSANSKQGLMQALAVAVYCGFIGLFILNAEDFIEDVPNFFGPITMLLLFSTSALICALIVFYKPYNLFFAGKKEDAIDMVVYTTFWMFLLFVISFLLVVLT